MSLPGKETSPKSSAAAVRLPVWETNGINGAGAAPQVVGRISRFPDRERRHYRCTPAQKRTTVSANRHDWASPGSTTQNN